MLIVTWHGEGKSLFYIVDETTPEKDQPAVVATFETRTDAEHFIRL